MKQRLVVVSALVSMTLSVVLTAMVASMIHGQQQTNAALIEQISKLAVQKPAPAPERDPRWNNLKIKVTLDSKTGPAADGLSVTVSKLPEIGEVIAEESENSAVSKTKVARQKHQATTDAQGVVDCGFVSPGLYELEVDSQTSESFKSTFTIYPGRDHVEEVVAPGGEPELVDVSLHLDGLPEDVDSKKYGLLLGFHQFGGRKIDGQPWKASGWFPFNSTPFVLIIPGRGIWMAVIPPGGDQWGRYPNAIFYPQKGKSATWKRLEQPYRLRVPAYQYSVCFDFIRVPSQMTPDDPEWNRNTLHDPKDTRVEWKKGQPDVEADPSVIKLVARAGEVNEWTVGIPSPLLNAWEPRALASLEKKSPARVGSSENRNFRRFGNGPNSSSILPTTPCLVLEVKRDSDLALRLNLTTRQQSELNDLWNSRVRGVTLPNFNAASAESKAKVIELFKSIDKEALEILTIEQKQLWEERRAELMQQQFDAVVQSLKEAEENSGGKIGRLRHEVYVVRAKLTEEQTQKFKEVESQLDIERRNFVEANTLTEPDEKQKNWLIKFQEYDKEFVECLTEEQKADLLLRTGPATRPPR